MATMIDDMRSYITQGAAQRGWAWNECDCIGLMFRLVRKFADCQTERSDYIPDGLSYSEAVKWLGATFDDPLIPYLRVLETDSKLMPPMDGEQPHIILMANGPDLVTDQGNRYPIRPVPGLAFQPEGMPPYIFGAYGYESVNIPKADISDLYEYRLPIVRV